MIIYTFFAITIF